VSVLKELQPHPNVHTDIDSARRLECCYLVTELCDHDLLSVLRACPTGLRVVDALKLTRELASGLAYEHACRIVHSDLKPENILLARNGQ
jgi:serine/threonine-protein kinase